MSNLRGGIDKAEEGWGEADLWGKLSEDGEFYSLWKKMTKT